MKDTRKEWLEVVRKWRLHPDGPADARYWAPELEAVPPERLKEIQSEKLDVLARYLHEHSAFYRNKLKAAKLVPRDIRSVDDLHKIPLTTKQEMVRDVAEHPPWGTYLAIDDSVWRARGWLMFATSGTTAAPRAFRHTLHDRDQWAWNDARGLWAQGIKPGEHVAMIAFGYAPHVFFWGVHYAFNLMGIPVVPCGSLDTGRRIYFIDTFKPTLLCATPSYAFYLASKMHEAGTDPAASSIRNLLVGGEPGGLIPATKRRLEEAWNATVHEFYGCTEVSPTPGGYTCEFSGAMEPGSEHLLEDQQIWEVVSADTLEPLPDGERGLSVATNLFSEAAPLLRFLIGDYTRLVRRTCKCGRTHKHALGGFCGRADDMLNVRGITIFPSAIEDALRSIPELGTEYQIVLTNERVLDVLTIVCEARGSVSPGDHGDLKRRITERVQTVIEVRPDVEIVAEGTLEKPQFKAQRVVDRRRTS